MHLSINLQSRLDQIPPKDEFWNTDIQQAYYRAADKLIDLGMDAGDAIDFLSDLYWATLEEFESRP